MLIMENLTIYYYQLYINTEKVGHSILPIHRPDYAPPSDSGAWIEQQPLTADENDKESWQTLEDKTPPIIMIGCHRHSEDKKFRDFSLPRAQFDELAIWTRKLSVNRSVNELLYFRGGYSKYQLKFCRFSDVPY